MVYMAYYFRTSNYNWVFYSRFSSILVFNWCFNYNDRKLFTDSIFIQTSVFIVTSTILIFATKPFVKHFDIPNPLRSNVYSLTDRIGIVIQEINSSNNTGQIKVDGETWTAITENPSLVIPEGSKVRIIKIKGVKAVVTKI